jgi:hypothetical protein
VEDKNDHDAVMFQDLIDSFNLQQHVKVATHSKGHILDLIMTRADENFISETYARDMNISDHFWVHANLLCDKVDTVEKVTKYRKIKHIDVDAFNVDISESVLGKPDEFSDISSAVLAYNQVLSELLDKHAPLQEHSFTVRKNSPWYNSEIGDAKRARRKAERLYRRTNLTVHKEIFYEAQQHVTNLIESAKRKYYSTKVDEAADQKALFKIVDSLLHRKHEIKLPSYSKENPKELADRFSEFFANKIMKIRQGIFGLQHSEDGGSRNAEKDINFKDSEKWSTFKPVTEDEVKKMILSTKSKSCSQDPIPTLLLKKCLGPLLPFITKVVNLSLSEGMVPSDLKKALLLPLLKKIDLDPDILKHFRPISNLTYLSKLIERLVAVQLKNHILTNKLGE